ncbi:MAG: hypothetical protein QM503_06595 [Bacteroidota bacterium]
MEALFEIVNNQMLKHKVEHFHVEIILVELEAEKLKAIPANNDFHFFVNAYTNGTTLNGKIRGTAGGNALQINPSTILSKLYKFQMFKGEVRITNISSTNTLFVELLRVSPLPQQITKQ